MPRSNWSPLIWVDRGIRAMGLMGIFGQDAKQDAEDITEMQGRIVLLVLALGAAAALIYSFLKIARIL